MEKPKDFVATRQPQQGRPPKDASFYTEQALSQLPSSELLKEYCRFAKAFTVVRPGADSQVPREVLQKDVVKADWVLKQFSEQELKLIRDKLLRVLLTTDMSSWSNYYLFQFVSHCPWEVNNGKLVQNAERLLVSRVDQMEKKDLIGLLSWMSTQVRSTERQRHQEKIVQVILTKKFEELEANELFFILNFCGLEQRQVIIQNLFQRQEGLSSVELLTLMKFLFITPPTEEIQKVMNTMYNHEVEKQKAEKIKKIAFIRPSYHAGNLPSQPQPIPGSHPLLLLGEAQPSRNLIYLQPHPKKVDNYYLDVTFNVMLEHQLASNSADGGAVGYGILLQADIPRKAGVAVFLSVPPFNKQSSHFVGYVTNGQPLLPLRYPLPVVGATSFVRIVAIILPLQMIQQQFAAQDIKAAAVQGVGRGVSFPASPHVSETGGVVTVCLGETHSFSLNKEETFNDLLHRAARRWKVDAASYELQDENYKVYEGSKCVLENLPSGALTRLTQKSAEAYGGAFPAFVPPLQQPQQQPFRPNIRF
jgi:hypothetical protein